MGTFTGYPTLRAYDINWNEIINKSSTGIKHITKQVLTMDRFSLNFRAYPEEDDINLSNAMFKSAESMTLWPCGGGYGSEHFLFDTDGWKLDDIYNVQTARRKGLRWYKNFYKSGINTSLNLIEVV